MTNQDDQIRALLTAVNVIANERDALAGRFAASEATRRDLQEQRDGLHNSVAQLERTNSALVDQVRSLEDKARAATVRAVQAENRADALQEHVDYLQARLDGRRMCVNCARFAPEGHDPQQPHPECAAVGKEGHACTFDVTAEEAIMHWREQFERERVRVKDNARELSKAIGEVIMLRNKCRSLEGDLEVTRGALRDVTEQSIELANEQCAELMQERDSLSAELRDVIEQKDRLIDAANERIAALTEKLDTAQEAQEFAWQLLENKQAAESINETEDEELARLRLLTQEQERRLDNAYSNYHKAITSLQEDLAIARNERDALNAEAEALRNQVAALQAERATENDVLRRRLRGLQEVLEETTQRATALREERDSARAALADMAQHVDYYERALRDAPVATVEELIALFNDRWNAWKITLDSEADTVTVPTDAWRWTMQLVSALGARYNTVMQQTVAPPIAFSDSTDQAIGFFGATPVSEPMITIPHSIFQAMYDQLMKRNTEADHD